MQKGPWQLATTHYCCLSKPTGSNQGPIMVQVPMPTDNGALMATGGPGISLLIHANGLGIPIHRSNLGAIRINIVSLHHKIAKTLRLAGLAKHAQIIGETSDAGLAKLHKLLTANPCHVSFPFDTNIVASIYAPARKILNIIKYFLENH